MASLRFGLSLAPLPSLFQGASFKRKERYNREQIDRMVTVYYAVQRSSNL